jgi:hypothetical protein
MSDKQALRPKEPNPLAGLAKRFPQAPRTQPSSAKPTFLARTKAWAWRASATYIWICFGAIPFGQYEQVRNVSGLGLALLREGLARVGFSPTDPSYFPSVVKFTWLQALTRASPIEIGGFFVYVLGFPLVVVFGFLGSRVFKHTHAETANLGTSSGATSKRRRRTPLLTVALAGLIAWFLLYGDSTAFRVMMAGLPFAGLLFGVLFYRFFRRVKPIGEEEAALLRRLEEWAFTFLKVAGETIPSTKAEIAMYRWTGGWAHRAYRRLAILVRGRRGRDRISIYVLLEYALSAIMLGVTAVAFWALVIRCAVAPSTLSMSEAIRLAAAHFLPGLPMALGNVTPPFWTSVAIGTTAWLLFVIVLAPAGSVLPTRQAAHAKRLAITYKAFRATTLRLGQFIAWLDRSDKQGLVEPTFGKP